MSDNTLAPRQNSELVKRSEGLAKRGLEIIEELKQIDVTLSESEILTFMERFRKIKNNIGEIPKEFLDGSTANPNDIVAFRINDFLLAFDKIHIRQNFILDYVYNFDGHYGGEPLIYARDKNSHPIESPGEYFEIFPKLTSKTPSGYEPDYESSLPYLSHLEFENSPIGYFEFAIFCMTIRRFYLYWHSNYNNRRYILTEAGLIQFTENKIGKITPAEIELLKSVKIAPKIEISNKSAQVSILSFEENIGYSFLRVHLKHPNIFKKIEDEVIIKNHTTLFF